MMRLCLVAGIDAQGHPLGTTGQGGSPIRVDWSSVDLIMCVAPSSHRADATLSDLSIKADAMVLLMRQDDMIGIERILYLFSSA